MTEAAWIVRVRSGKRLHAHAVMAPGATLRVGRDVPADLIIPDDRHLGLVHFTLQHQGNECVLHDGGAPGGTRVNGRLPDSAEVTLAHGAWVRAGETDFSIYREANTPPLDDAIETEHKRAALAALRGQPERLYGVFDSARDMRVLELLRESVEEVVSLYDGQAAEAMAEAAPYIVAFSQSSVANPPAGSLLERLVIEGWGQSWGIYLTSARPLIEVRRQLRRHLIVLNDQTEERLYFRFYDPRVLRAFLPTCLPKQRSEMFGELSRFVLEGAGGEVIAFAQNEKGAAHGGA